MIDYYWAKAEEALAKADAHPLLGNFFLSVALAYRLLACSEARFRSSRPNAPAHDLARRTSSAAPGVVPRGATV